MPITDPPVALLPQASVLIGDERRSDPSGGEYLHVYAATGKATTRVGLCGRDEMNDAVGAARDASPAWRAMPANQRRDLMLHFSRLVIENAEELTALQITETALPRRFASMFPSAAAD